MTRRTMGNQHKTCVRFSLRINDNRWHIDWINYNCQIIVRKQWTSLIQSRTSFAPLNLLPSHKFNFDIHATPLCPCTWNTIKNHETMRFHVEIDMATRSEPIKNFSIKLAGHTAKDNNSQRKTTSITAYLEPTYSVGFLRKLPTTFSYFFHFKFDSSSNAFQSSNSLAFTILVEQLPTKQAKHN